MIKKKLNLYLAAPLFSIAERDFNEKIVNNIEEYFDVFLPQRDGGLMHDMIKNGLDIKEASKSIFQKDINAIINSDIVLAVLDGRAVDEGVALEIGFAFAKGKKCFGFQSDPRRLLTYGNNPMIDNVLEKILEDFIQLNAWAKKTGKDRKISPNNILLLNTNQ